MEYRKSMIIIILAIFLVSIASVSAADADDAIIASEDTALIEVAQTDELSVSDDSQAIGQSNDEGIISEGNAGTFSELQNNITAISGGTLELDRNYEYDDGFDTDGIIIGKTITIDGKGHAIDAKGKARVFHILSLNVTIKNLIITNVNYNKIGGTIYFNDNGAVENCNFINNTGGWLGGVIYFNRNGNVINCNFTGNKATGSDNYGGAIYIYGNGNVTNCNFINNTAGFGGAIYFYGNGNITNCNFTNNTAGMWGGAISASGTVENCNFINNTAGNWGGAISASGTVENCNFINNTAGNWGGAIRFIDKGSVVNCNFTGNIAVTGSAINYWIISATKTISNSCFLNNRAKVDDVPLQIDENGNNIEITFIGRNNLINAIYSGSDVNFTNVTYWGAKGITNTGDSYPSRSNNESGQNITVKAFINGNILNTVKTTDVEGKVVLENIIGDYWISVRHDSDSYYTEAEAVFTNMTFYINVTEAKTTNKTVNITAKSNIYNEVMQGKLLFILPNGDEINATYVDGGIWWAEHTFNHCGDYRVNASYIGLSNVTVNNATISIAKANSTINVSDVVLYYGETKNVTVKTEGATAITARIDNTNVTVVNNYTIPISGLDAGNYTLTVTTIPDGDHYSASKTVNITVNKAGTEIILTNETLYLKAGDMVSDLANLTPGCAGNLTFTSSDEDIALVYDGTIWSRIKGNATVTVSFAGNDNYAASENKTITVYVSPKDASVSVENYTINLNVGDTCIIDATANPRFLTVYYASSNESVATVTDYGNVKAVGEGTAIITLTVGNGETYAVNSTNVTITVSKIPTEINIDPASLDLFVGDETVIVANLTPAGAGNVTFTSSDYDVVDFDDECNVIAQGKGQAIITVSFAGDNKYAAAENKTITVTVSLNDASVTVDNDTLDLNVGETYAINATKSPDTILLDIAYTSSNNSVATVNENGVVTAVGEGTAIITVEVGDGEIYAINSTNVTVTVSRIPTEIAADPITATYNADKYLVITLKDANGTPISGENITVDVNGIETYLTDENGSVKVSTNGLASGIYDAKITFNGSAKYYNSAKAVNVTINKATPVINATAKTFKTTDKTKKYMVILKDNNGNPMANATVTLKVNGKIYYAKTDENGQATFRLTKLTRVATYTAAITYRGDDNYKKVFQKVKLTVKTGFKTVSKGSKDKAIVKKIQMALKSNGYYIKSNGHKLKVDGIYDIYTEKAVKQFQKANGLKVTGKVDENTALKLGII